MMPQHREKGGVELGRDMRSRAVLDAIGLPLNGSTEKFSATPPKSGQGAERGPGMLSDAIRAVKG